MLFNNRKKHAWRQQSPLRMLPADESLGPYNLAGAHVHLGLVIEGKLVRRHGLADALQVLMPAADNMVVFGIEDVVAMAACQLGLVHGLVGLAQQRIRIQIELLWIKGHANTGRHAQR
jgi:hypothetical protein